MVFICIFSDTTGISRKSSNNRVLSPGKKMRSTVLPLMQLGLVSFVLLMSSCKKSLSVSPPGLPRVAEESSYLRKPPWSVFSRVT